ncbi:GNAT family N-acetyltransferase [Bordetella sp. BOR01]|uniref:GNAT family N-acetyltransferase n=1 Tax=Bordetella sp. BOR01 TaxID=2854779 RepID=UPI001C48F91C|nr:N-acetyltransferase [Bordetella sp. BOR01]MBV7486802.1 N-acetyltransferase [Bordetella sp. BOR01]
MLLRPETDTDIAAIFTVTQDAFRDQPHSEHTEGPVIDALRAAGALALSLVAEQDGQVVGHVAFSPVSIAGPGGVTVGWYGLGPIAVAPAMQGQGVGSMLVIEGLARLRGRGAAGCVVLGEPHYYRRFGFRPDAGLVLPDMPAEYFMAQAWHGRAQGTVQYHTAFDTPPA